MPSVTQEDIELAIGPAETSIITELTNMEERYLKGYAARQKVGNYERDKFLRGIEIAKDSIRLSVKYRLIAAAQRRENIDEVH